MVAAGHGVENHTMHHRPWFGFLPPEVAAAELTAAQEAICEAGAPRPRFVRPPAAVLTPRVAAAARIAGLALAGHSVRGYDHAPRLAGRCAAARVARRLRPGAIVLLHDAPRRPGAPPAGG